MLSRELARPRPKPVPAKICFEHDPRENLYYLTIEVEGLTPALNIGLDHRALEELLDAGCVVFLDLHPHVHTQVPCHPCVARGSLN